MAKCRKCKEPFKPTIHNIEYCLQCIKSAYKQYAKLPINEVISKQANSIFKS